VAPVEATVTAVWVLTVWAETVWVMVMVAQEELADNRRPRTRTTNRFLLDIAG